MQIRPVAQPLWPAPGQQPSTQSLVSALQMRPEVAPPQSASVAHPQNAGSVAPVAARHAWPLFSIAQAVASPLAPGTQSTQRSTIGSHTAVTPVQAAAAVLVHCAQRPAKAPAVTHTGVLPAQSVAAQARQACAVRSQIGVAPEQSGSPVQLTHVSVVVSQTDVAPVQAPVMPVAHCTQVPVCAPVVAHTPTAPEQSVPVHPRQARVVASQIGVGPEQ